MQALNTTPPRDEGAVLVLGIARLFYRKDKRNNAGTKHPPPRDKGAVLVFGIARLFHRKDKRNNVGTKHHPSRD